MWSPSRRLQFDTRSHPIVYISFLAGWSEADLRWMFAEFDKLFRSPQRYVLIVDTTGASNAPSASERKAITDWDNANTANVERCSVGCAVVFTSAIIRGSLTALSWIARRSNPITYVPTTDEAARWCLERLRETGVPISIGARSFLAERGVTTG